MRLPVRITTSRCWSWDRRSRHVKWWSAGSRLVTKSMPLQQWSKPFIARRTRRAGCDWPSQYYRGIPRQYYHFAQLLNDVSGGFGLLSGTWNILLRYLRSFGHFISIPNISSPSLSFFPSFFLSLSLSLSFLGLSRCIRIESSTSFSSRSKHFCIFCHQPVISQRSHLSSIPQQFCRPSPPPDWHISGAAVEALVPMVQSSSPQTPFSLLGKARKVQKA